MLYKRLMERFVSNILLLCFCAFPESPVQAKANNPEVNQSLLSTQYLKKLPINDYILGPGDGLRIIISREIPEMTDNYIIDSEGTIYLPELHRTFVSGLTVNELNILLEKEYKKFVLNPLVETIITNYRMVRVYIDGEVQTPGKYILDGSRESRIFEKKQDKRFGQSEFNDFSGFDTDDFKTDKKEMLSKNEIKESYLFPTLFDLIKESGGIHLSADLSNIEIIRLNPISKGGGRVKAKINFLRALKGEDFQTMNTRIMDGDYIKIKKSDNPIVKQLNDAIKSNLNPKFISVYISGRVESPGQVNVPKTSTLSEAIYVAGGVKSIRGKIIFIRFNQDGTIDQRKINYNQNNKKGSYHNPYVREGDLIFVGKGSINNATEIIDEVTRPFVGIASVMSLIRFFRD